MNSLWQTLMENLSFVVVVLGIFAGLVLLALGAERTVCRPKGKRGGARYLAVCGMCAALGGVLMALEFPIFFAPAFYQLDLGELPMLFCGFYLGPVAGVVCELLKVTVKLLLKGTSTAFVGDFANFCVGCAMVLPASVIYHAKKTRRGALLALGCGIVSMTVFGSAFNAFYLIPKFSQLFSMPLGAIVAAGNEVNPRITSVGSLVLCAVVPMNLLKGTVVSVLTFTLYKRLERVIFRR